MSELERLGVDPEPNISINGIGLTRLEHDAYKELSDPMPFIENVVETAEFNNLNDKDRSLSLQLIVNQFQDNAEKEILGDNEFFKDFRQRIRESQ